MQSARDHVARWFAHALALLVFFATSAAATPILFVASLSGPGESPPNGSPGTGAAAVTIDPAVHTLHVQVSFADLLGATTASHIHCCVEPPLAAPVATTVPTFPDFPLGVMSGTYDHTFDTLLASSYNPSFVASSGGTVASAEAALFTAMIAGETYLNIHTTVDPGGEIRGFLVAAAPEPGTLALIVLALAFAAGAGVRQRHLPQFS
jgi:CHRD domain-containing protein